MPQTFFSAVCNTDGEVKIMDNNQAEKTPKVVSKSFMAVGPTLHYSHANVQWCWLLAVAAFSLSCLFWSKIITGSFWDFDLNTVINPQQWYFGRFTANGVSIFEYPWQIFVLGLLMGILAIVPVLISQLMSFSHSIPFIFAVFFLANLPAFAACILISCVAAACRPLRFRSRFIAIALCASPQLLYWGYFGGIKGVEPIQWGFSFTPWINAGLVGMAIAGLVLGIGHFTRYRPGLVWAFTSLVLVTAVVVFEVKIGFDELDYQLYVAKNNPEQATEFHDHGITEALDETLTNPAVRRYLAGFFYPTEPIPLRAELKKEIQIQLGRDRWPSWFIVPDELNYQAKKQRLFEKYDKFIKARPKSQRMPIALYYKAILNEYSPDLETLARREILHFYSDYPYEMTQEIWYRLYTEFGDSPESLEARWRIATHWAGKGRFEQADKLLAEAQAFVADRLNKLSQKQTPNVTFFSQFRPPVESVISTFKLTELQRKINLLRSLISPENRTIEPVSAARLAKFVLLNPHGLNYHRELEAMLVKMDDSDPLRDNVLLAQTRLIADEQLRAEKLAELHNKFQNTDGGMHALYELGLLKRRLWSQQDDSNLEQKKRYLAETRATFTGFMSLYSTSFFADQVKKNLDDLPGID